MMAAMSRVRTRRNANSKTYIILALSVLVLFWCVCLVVLSLQWPSTAATTAESIRGIGVDSTPDHAARNPILLSRSPSVRATADVQGNLGSPSVILQVKPGEDWLHDRWQAASDMHGTNIPGEHWIRLDFGEMVLVDSIVLDWETAYADNYRLEAYDNDNLWILFDGTDLAQEKIRSVSQSGQSPGVKQKRPLHVIHTLSLSGTRPAQKPLRALRLHILKSATGWGVSLWQFDVYGFHQASEALQR